jgi:hypothetical protein
MARDSSVSMFFRYWRILLRARPVRTMLSQPGLGLAPGAVMISTTSPLLSSVRSAAGSPLILAATVCWPTSEWMAKAKSTGVAPRGSARILLRGVNT